MKQSEMRFDGPPGHYTDYRGGGGRRGSHLMPKRKIELSTKEPVELRKAEHRWVRPQNADGGSLDEGQKETQVVTSWLPDCIYVCRFVYKCGNLRILFARNQLYHLGHIDFHDTK